MKIKTITTVGIQTKDLRLPEGTRGYERSGFTYILKGEVVELRDTLAKNWIDDGLAVKAHPEDAPEKKAETSAPPEKK